MRWFLIHTIAEPLLLAYLLSDHLPLGRPLLSYLLFARLLLSCWLPFRLLPACLALGRLLCPLPCSGSAAGAAGNILPPPSSTSNRSGFPAPWPEHSLTAARRMACHMRRNCGAGLLAAAPTLLLRATSAATCNRRKSAVCQSNCFEQLFSNLNSSLRQHHMTGALSISAKVEPTAGSATADPARGSDAHHAQRHRLM